MTGPADCRLCAELAVAFGPDCRCDEHLDDSADDYVACCDDCGRALADLVGDLCPTCSDARQSEIGIAPLWF
jgi:hypothetical protein